MLNNEYKYNLIFKKQISDRDIMHVNKNLLWLFEELFIVNPNLKLSQLIAVDSLLP